MNTTANHKISMQRDSWLRLLAMLLTMVMLIGTVSVSAVSEKDRGADDSDADGEFGTEKQGLIGITGWSDPALAHAAFPKQNADVPGIDSEVSVINGLAILEAYDPDGSFILNDSESRNGNNYLWFWGALTNPEGINNSLLNEYTALTRKTYAYDAAKATVKDRYYNDFQYIGQECIVEVPITEVFMTEEWSNSLPNDLRQLTYKSYVAKGSTNSANQRGAYGLLTEFVGSVWALNSQICMLDYYKSQPYSITNWGTFVQNCECDISYIKEFNFYILGYLDFAEKNYPEIRNKVVNNEKFVSVYGCMKDKADSLIKKYESAKQDIIRLGEKEGYAVSIADGYISMGGDDYYTGGDDDYYSWLYSLGYDDFDDYGSYWGGSSSMGIDISGRKYIEQQISSKELKAQEKALTKVYKQVKTDSNKLNKKKAKFTASDGSVYKVTQKGSKSKQGKVQYVKSPTGSESVNIPSVITIRGIEYSVASIGKDAFANNDSIRSIRIGANVKGIGAKAFYNCRNLESIKIESKKLTKSSVQNDAFSNGADKLNISVPSKCLSEYKTLLQGCGVSKKANIDKYQEVDLKVSENKHQYYKNISSDKAKKADEIAKMIADKVMNDPALTTDLQRVAHASVLVADYSIYCVYGNDSNKYYRSPYGVFISGNHTCAGDARAMGRVLDYMGISWEHVNENENRHQWCVFEMDGIKGFADGGAGVAGYGTYKSGIQAPDGSYIVFPA